MDGYEAISLSGAQLFPHQKLFSVDEANRSLTLVRRIVADIVHHYDRLCRLHLECQSNSRECSSDEAECARREYVSESDLLSELNEELEKVGCELRDYQTGEVEFPARQGEREIFLCWRLGENRVSYWHELDEPGATRHPLTSLTTMADC